MPKRKLVGRGVMDVLRYIKNNKLVSKGLGLIDHPYAQGASSVASMLGLGRKRKRRRTQGGRGFFTDIGNGLGGLAGGLGGGLGSLAHGLFGGKRKPRRTMRGSGLFPLRNPLQGALNGGIIRNYSGLLGGKRKRKRRILHI